jgi:hypothetical protein
MAPQLFPVIHHDSPAETLRNAEIAVRHACAGVFLINMDGPHTALDAVAGQIRGEFPDLWLGVNRLGDIRPEHTDADLLGETGFNGVWLDDVGIHSVRPRPTLRNHLQEVVEFAQSREADVRLFGSVAFKTQMREPDPARVALEAASLGWTPTTSGVATGEAADPTQPQAMKAAIAHLPGARLAIASGITPENVTLYLDSVDDFLVATGISETFHRFDERKVAALSAAISVAGD